MKPTPEQIEAGLKAQQGSDVYLLYRDDPEALKSMEDNVAAILAAALSVPAAAVVGEPDGWKLVPIEPTPEMLVDIAKACRDFLSDDGPYPRAKAVYRATISSAPKPNGANNDA